MAYSELIKNFEKVRAYMREFYVYGFKSRTEYDAKSARSYDDERRRLESWLGDYMRFTQTPEGKNVFLSVDSRVTRKNPFYKAWKAKSFTDGDITLHFAIFDILYDPETKMTLTELIEEIDQRLSSSMAFDESTLRKKLKEYAEEGIIRIEKDGRKVLYSRALDTDIAALHDVIDFFSEVAPCGVIGSFLQDRQPKHPELFSFKHHYITQAMDSDVMATLFEAIHGHRYITVDNLGKHSNEVRTVRLVPLKLYISAQNGRQNLLAFHEKANRLNSYRLDYRLARLNGELLDKNGKKSIYNCENYKYLLDAPFKISARCCYHMKKAPLNKFERQSGRHPITGVLACESKLREQSWIKFGCNGFERQRPLSQPLAFWLEEDILRYLKMTGIPYAPIYGDIVESRKKNGTPILKTTGVSRSGCMYCMYGVHLEHEPNRFQLMQVTHPQQYDYCINKLGCGAVLDYIGVPYRNQQLEVDHC